jgi:hypothetical protein
VKPRSYERELSIAHDTTFQAITKAAASLKWDAAADGAEGGLDLTVKGSASLLRPKLTIRVRLIDLSASSTAVRAVVDAPGVLPLRAAQADETLERFFAVLDGDAPQPLVVGAGSPVRVLVRTITGTLVLLALVIAALVAIPTKMDTHGDRVANLPSIALGQTSLYRVEVGLAVFYAGLIVLTPIFYGLVRGRLPIEISPRGAKFSEDAAENVDRSLKDAQALADQLKREVRSAQAQLARARLNIDQLASATETTLND